MSARAEVQPVPSRVALPDVAGAARAAVDTLADRFASRLEAMRNPAPDAPRAPLVVLFDSKAPTKDRVVAGVVVGVSATVLSACAAAGGGAHLPGSDGGGHAGVGGDTGGHSDGGSTGDNGTIGNQWTDPIPNPHDPTNPGLPACQQAQHIATHDTAAQAVVEKCLEENILVTPPAATN